MDTFSIFDVVAVVALAFFVAMWAYVFWMFSVSSPSRKFKDDE